MGSFDGDTIFADDARVQNRNGASFSYQSEYDKKRRKNRLDQDEKKGKRDFSRLYAAPEKLGALARESGFDDTQLDIKV